MDVLDAKVADFLIAQALEINVISKIELKTPRNPNRVSKTLAPWFTT